MKEIDLRKETSLYGGTSIGANAFDREDLAPSRSLAPTTTRFLTISYTVVPDWIGKVTFYFIDISTLADNKEVSQISYGEEKDDGPTSKRYC